MADKDTALEKLTFDLTERALETQRLAKQARDGDNVRTQLLAAREVIDRLEEERETLRGKAGEAEARASEISEVLNIELQKGYEMDRDRQQMRVDQEYQIECI